VNTDKCWWRTAPGNWQAGKADPFCALYCHNFSATVRQSQNLVKPVCSRFNPFAEKQCPCIQTGNPLLCHNKKRPAERAAFLARSNALTILIC
jgi:hypothetical protein